MEFAYDLSYMRIRCHTKLYGAHTARDKISEVKKWLYQHLGGFSMGLEWRLVVLSMGRGGM